MTVPDEALRALTRELALPARSSWSQRALGDPLEPRPVVRLTHGGRHLVARALGSRRAAERLELMQALSACHTEQFAVPRPIAALPGGWFVEEFIDRAEVDGSEPIDLPARIGVALAELHGLPLARGRPCTLGEHLDELVRPHPTALVESVPDARVLVRDALAAIATQRSEGVAPVPLHRDFHLRQLLVGERVWVVDWDTFGWGDPAFDVGYFATYLQTHLPAATAREWCETFLDAYCGHSGHDVRPRLAIHRLYNHLRRACRRLRRREEAWRSRMERSLDGVREALAELDPH